MKCAGDICLALQIVGEGCVEILQQKALALIQMGAQSSLLSAMEFEQLDGSRLIQQVLRTPKASVGPAILEVTACSPRQRCKVT